jgi:hypothetical protein
MAIGAGGVTTVGLDTVSGLANGKYRRAGFQHGLGCNARIVSLIMAASALGIALEQQILWRVHLAGVSRHDATAREYGTQDRASKYDREKLLESGDMFHAAIPLHFCRLTDQAFICSR